MACPICQTRKEKRFCPALHDRICAVCCGTEREVSLDCPSECVYLRQARAHERPRELAELHDVELFPQVEIRESFLVEREPLLIGLSYALAQPARADRSLRDIDAIAALTGLAKAQVTLASSGLITQTQTTGPAQALVAELQKMLEEYRATEEKHLGYSALRDAEVLEALVFLVRMAHARTSGRPRSRAFLDFLLARFPEKSGIVTPTEAGSRIIVP
jgi:hypothetical protein